MHHNILIDLFYLKEFVPSACEWAIAPVDAVEVIVGDQNIFRVPHHHNKLSLLLLEWLLIVTRL